MRVLGIDPGLSGALALIDFASAQPRLISVLDVPTISEGAKRRVWISPLMAWFDGFVSKPKWAFIERAQAMPEQGASSGFAYGRAVGYLEAVTLCAGIPLRTAEPQTWKRRLGLIGQDKGGSLELARKLVDNLDGALDRKKDHNRAEAMLIAYYGAQELTKSTAA